MFLRTFRVEYLVSSYMMARLSGCSLLLCLEAMEWTRDRSRSRSGSFLRRALDASASGERSAASSETASKRPLMCLPEVESRKCGIQDGDNCAASTIAPAQTSLNAVSTQAESRLNYCLVRNRNATLAWSGSKLFRATGGVGLYYQAKLPTFQNPGFT